MNASESNFEGQTREKRAAALDSVALDLAALTVRTARELTALPEPPESEQLLGDLVTRAGRLIIVADTGHGKTSLGMQIAAGVLTGADVLGYTGAKVGPVLIVDLEQGIRSIKRTLRDAGLSERDDVLYLTVPDGLALDKDAVHRAELERIVQTYKPVLLILDPYYKAHRSDSNEERAIVDLMRYLDGLRAEHGFALILPAHPRKDQNSNGARKLSLHDVAGSGAVVRGAEVVIGLERLSHGYARLRILKDRDGDLPVGEAWPLRFARCEGFKLDPKEKRTTEDVEQRILADTGEWRTVKEWGTELGIRETHARGKLDALAEAGLVETMIGPPGRSPKARCYRTAPAPGARSGAVTQSRLDESTAPTAPTSIEDVSSGSGGVSASESGAVTRTSGLVIIGDEWYPVALATAGKAGHITPDELSARYRLHKLVERFGMGES